MSEREKMMNEFIDAVVKNVDYDIAKNYDEETAEDPEEVGELRAEMEYVLQSFMDRLSTLEKEAGV